MPITVTAPAGCLTPTGEREILPRLTATLLDAARAAGNPFLTSIVGGTVNILDPDAVFAGGTNRPLLLIELKLPAVALADPESQAAFIENATQVAESLTSDGHERDHIWINILHARDGAWGLGGKAYSNDALLAAAAAETPATVEVLGVADTGARRGGHE